MRRKPKRIHAQVFEIIQFGGDASEVADAVAVAVRKRTRINLIEDRFLPPFHEKTSLFEDYHTIVADFQAGDKISPEAAMKKIASLIGALILFALVWAAGHDILVGEPDVWLEYTMVCTGLVLAISGLFWKIQKIKLGGHA